MMEQITLPDLPGSWIWTSLGKIYDIVGGGTPSTNNPEYWNGDIPWISSADINGLKDIRPRRFITKDAIKESATNLVPINSLIVVTRVGLGKVALAKSHLCFSQDSQALIPTNSHIDPLYSLYYLSNAVQIFRYKHRGTTIAGVTKKQLSSLSYPLAPLPEQHRIVARIEELFSRLDAGVEELKKAKAQLQRYRQSVLKAAFEGKLTEVWRNAHLEIEPAKALLNRIKSNRIGFGQISFEGDAFQETDKHPNLPENWTWIRLGQIFGVYVGATPRRNKPEYWGGDIPWVSSGEVAFCRVYSTRETISQLGMENSSTKIHPSGTVLLGMIGEGKTRGQAAILDIAACNNQNSAAIRVSEVGLPPEYVYYYLEHEYERTRKLSSGNNQPALNKKRVQSMQLPLPPFKEQQKIVEEIERCTSVIEEIEKSIDENQRRANNFRQSILKRAFEGRLVPQDPNDEPASILLERIRAERVKESPRRGRKSNIHQMRLAQ